MRIIKWERWKEDKDFLEVYAEIRGITLLSEDRCYALYLLSLETQNIEGDVAEVGVFRGGSARLLARMNSNKKVHLFDTFSGILFSEPDIDFHHKGDFARKSLHQEVSIRMADFSNVVIHEGTFPLTGDEVSNERFSLVHLDVDVYRTTLDCLLFFYERMSSNGVIVLDDYKWRACPGVEKAITEFLNNKTEEVVTFAPLQAVIIKD